MARPDKSLMAPYFHQYIDKVEGQDLLIELLNVHNDTQQWLQALPEDIGDYAYADGKWTVKQVISHLVDTERVFCYRSLSFARGDKTELPGFDHDQWAVDSMASERRLNDLASEWGLVREATVALYSGFNEKQMAASGIANGNPLSVHGMGFVIIGHELHHINVVKERYL